MNIRDTRLHRYSFGMILMALLLGLSACRFDFEHEIWFNKDLSGKASIRVYARDLIFDSDEQAQTQLETNALQKYVDLIQLTPGARLTTNKITDLSTGEGTSYSYEVEFTFDSPVTLNKIIALKDSLAVKKTKSGKFTSIAFNPPAMSMLEKAELDRQIGNVADAAINYYLEIHAPTKVQKSSDYIFEPYDEKSRKWALTVNDDWFASPFGEYYIEY